MGFSFPSMIRCYPDLEQVHTELQGCFQAETSWTCLVLVQKKIGVAGNRTVLLGAMAVLRGWHRMMPGLGGRYPGAAFRWYDNLDDNVW